jgi:hypothetical protein
MQCGDKNLYSSDDGAVFGGRHRSQCEKTAKNTSISVTFPFQKNSESFAFLLLD